MKRHSIFLAAAAHLCGVAVVTAQLQVTRDVLLEPFVDSVQSTGFLQAHGVTLEVNRGFGSADGELAWNTKAGGVIEFYRWDDATLSLLFGNEMIGNAKNDIGFNPRQVRWEEALVLSKKVGDFTLQLGGIHQCKHDVDNSDPLDSDDPDITAIAKRVVILSGPYASVLSPTFQLLDQLSVSAYARADWYPASSEYRFPANSQGRSLADAAGNISAGGRISYLVGTVGQGYILGWGAWSVPGGSFAESFSFRGEAGIGLKGKIGTLHPYIAIEHFADDLTRYFPQRSTVIQAGFRFNSSMLR